MGDLLSDGKVSRGWLGVSMQEIDQSIAKALNLNPAKGALISEVFENSPAEKGGIKIGDVVRTINGKTIEDANDLRHTVAMLRPGETADFEVLRDGKNVKLKVTIALRDENSLAGVMPGQKDKKEQKAESGKNEWGIQAAELTEAQKKEAGLSKSSGGVLVASVAEKSPAEKAGLKKGDIILVANHKGIANLKDFNAIFGESRSTMLLLIRRGGNQTYIALEK
jgi:serine protease Do